MSRVPFYSKDIFSVFIFMEETEMQGKEQKKKQKKHSV